ncbi:MAG: hypothetical protein HN657_02545 [Candidatus Marinimicrobia bacterium]|jgi:nitrate/TMAO reductase-like tetraheme cytochrome c subunit|nr:hypothetical protein [Candidatus Neomarinimicrobiota bacterium]MBT3496408.1 hypothetical protein [Candidatus Neomarinimicrobiota bacterium]MBT3732332.1 hypothetical protein [Candidatus Neomarinimicrobiota bacterium]MBT4143654.1 hypothetical protein [Candidatus Neomarinimicrobiota bacterium]MBT4176811.1 hypothetical protein [Candidatus Neomarinimicrobiota bacterium]
MKKLIITLFVSLGFLFSQDYVGVKKCKTCHNSKKKGAQFKVWEAGPHAKSYETLKTDRAIEVAKSVGLEGNPWESSECLRCHTTGYEKSGYELKGDDFWTFDPKDKKAKKATKRMTGLQNVSCEACHGPGSDYKKKKTMAAITAGEITGESVGLWTPSEAMCVACHNQASPTYKEFNYEERIKEVSHPYPDELK